jgi:inorganic triphosphatase YgiF
MLEVELKFRATGPEPLEALRGAATLGEAALGAPAAFDELDRYLDTADLRLAAQRWACRLRTREKTTIVSLKGPALAAAGSPSAAALHRRPELEGPATADADATAWPASAARDRLLELTDGEPLIERLALAQRRTERDVILDGAPAATLSLDHVRVLRAGEQHGELWCVELEQHAGARVDLEGMARALAAVPGLAPDPLTKLEHALRLARLPAAT